MARGSSSQKGLLERQFRSYMAKHKDVAWAGAEAYEFNIKMYRIYIPDIVRRAVSEDYISERVSNEQGNRLLYFAEDMKDTYLWISTWGQTGRSGGWLFFTTEAPVLDDNWSIPGRDPMDNTPQDWEPNNLAPAESRLEDLAKIKNAIDVAQRALEKDLASPAWWDIGPHDWTPRTKPKMGGIFDFLRKKKGPAQQDLIRVQPIEVIPAGSLIPAGPPTKGAFANPFELLAPPAPARGVVPFVAQEPRPMFDVLAPSAPARRREQPLEPAWPTAAQLPPPVLAPRPRASWSLPGPDELAHHLRSTLNLPAIFSQIRAARKAPDFRRHLARWGAQGLPALIPVTPVASQEIYGDFARFFGVPYSVLDTYARGGDVDDTIWTGLLWPLFDRLSEVFEIEKPADLPGWFALEHDPDTDEWWLVYLETD